jgi:two-component system invasion response regulator UvrY
MSRIYLVDDHAMLRDGLRAVLEAAGHQVVGETADPGEALAALRRLSPDVVLLDLNLGNERSGFELLTALQPRGLAVKVIVLTMSAQPRHVAEALRLGATGYVLKGSPSAELLQAIDAARRGQRHLGARAAELAAEHLNAAHDAQDVLAQLSPREQQIIAMVVNGQSSSGIGQQLHLSPKTVDTYRSRLMQKLGIADLPALVRLAVRTGLIDASAG